VRGIITFASRKTGDYDDDRYIKVITGDEPSSGLVITPSHFLYASIPLTTEYVKNKLISSLK
jgi:hypothetical protein